MPGCQRIQPRCRLIHDKNISLRGADRATTIIQAANSSLRVITADSNKGLRLENLTITGGHGTQYDWPMAWEVDGAAEFLSGVRKQASLGADLIKVMATRPALSPPYRGGPSFTVEEMREGGEGRKILPGSCEKGR